MDDSIAGALNAILSLEPVEVPVERRVVLTLSADLWRDVGEATLVVSLDLIYGLSTWSDRYAGDASARRPVSIEECAELITQYAPSSMCLDATLLLGRLHNRWEPGWKDRSTWIADLLTGLPEEEQPEALDEIDAVSGLLIWAANLPTSRVLHAVVPTGMAMHSRHTAFREYMHKHLRLGAALRLPTGVFSDMLWVAPTILAFWEGRERAYVDDVPAIDDLVRYASQPWFDRLLVWLGEGETLPEHTIVPSAEAVWGVPTERDVETLRERLSKLGSLVPLGDVCEVFQGKRIAKRQLLEDGDIPLIGRSTLSTGTIALAAAQRVALDLTSIGDKYLLKSDDILMSTTITDRLLVVRSTTDEKAVITDGVVVVRPNDARVTEEFISEYLNSDSARDFIDATAYTDPFLGIKKTSATKMRDLPIPLIDPTLVQGLAQLEETEQSLLDRAAELRRRRRELFSADDGNEFRASLSELKRRGNLLSGGIQQADSLQYQISNFYPFPIAFGHRHLGVGREPVERYKEQMRFAENILAFLGSIALALVLPEDRERARIDIRALWRGGIAPGNWRDATVRASTVLADYHDNALAQSIAGLSISSGTGFGQDINALIEAKNAFKHERGPNSPGKYQQAIAIVGERLDRCMAHLAFFTDHPLRQLADYGYRRQGGGVLEYLSCVGDHPSWAGGRMTTSSSFPMGIPIKGELYIVVDHNRWVPVYPFLTARECATCSEREVFLVDRWREDTGKTALRGLERGHAMVDTDMSGELAQWP